MHINYINILVILGLMVGSILASLLKKGGRKEAPCSGCPNYSHCRAHIGCNNNPKNRKKKEL